MKMKRILVLAGVTILMTCILCIPAYAAGGDVAGAIEGTWKTASQQIKTVVNNVVFPAIDLILAVIFLCKAWHSPTLTIVSMASLNGAAPAILFACLVFSLTAPMYVWQVLGM